MKDYLRNILHMDIKIDEAENVYKDIPLYYKGAYRIYKVSSDGVTWLALKPIADVRLDQLRKNRAFLENKKQLNVALFLESSSLYSKDKMIEEGIPFVIKDDTVYLPFLGMLLTGKNRELKPIHQISFLTQKILLTCLYEGYKNATVSVLAEQLNVSKMAVSKCFDEMEYLGLDILKLDKRRRYISMGQDRRRDWNEIRPVLRSPVIKIFELKEDIGLEKKAGISALSMYSLLEDNEYPTYAVEKREIRTLGILEKKRALKTDKIGCRIMEVGYFIDSMKKNVQDPLSVILSIEDESEDERVEMSIDEMLKEYVW